MSLESPNVPPDPLNETRRELIKLFNGSTSMPATQLVSLLEKLIEHKLAEDRERQRAQILATLDQRILQLRATGGPLA